MAPTTRFRVVSYTDEEILDRLGEVADDNDLTLSKTAEYLIRAGLKYLDESGIPITKIGK